MAKWKVDVEGTFVMLMKKSEQQKAHEKMIANWPSWVEDDGFITVHPKEYCIEPKEGDKDE